MLDKQNSSKLSDALNACKKLFYTPSSLSLDPNLATYPGQLVIEHALRSKTKSYRIVDNKQQQVKKTIVLSDWSLAVETNRIIADASILIDGLLEAGFDVQYWNGKQLVKLNRGEIVSQYKLIKALPTNLFDKLKKQSQASDALFNLDYFEMPKLLQDPELAWQFNTKKKSDVLDVADLASFESIPNEILQWLKDKSFILRLGRKKENPSNKKSKNIFSLLLKLFDGKIKGVVLNKVKNTALFEQIVNNEDLEQITWREDPWQNVSWEKFIATKQKKLVFPKLKKLYLKSAFIPATVVAELLNSADELQNLVIDEGRNLQDLKLDPHKNFDTLKKATFSEANLSPVAFAKLCSSASLKSLQLRSCTINHEDSAQLRMHKNIFSELSDLTLSNSTFVHGPIDFILQRSHNLKHLEIRNCKGLDTLKITSDHNNFCLPNLISFETSGLLHNIHCDIPHATIAAILSGANNLEILKLCDLQGAEKFMPEILPDDLQLPRLKTINLTSKELGVKGINQEIPVGTYLKLLSSSPLVKEIDLQRVTNLDNIFHSNSLSDSDIGHTNLEHIKSINASGSTITSYQLIKILKKTPNLQFLALKKCQKIASLKPEDIPDDIVFNELSTINVTGSQIRGDTLAKLISKAPNLKIVNANDCGNLGESFNLSQISSAGHLKFKQFSAKGVNISAAECIWLLKRCESISFLSEFDHKLIADSAAFTDLIEIKDSGSSPNLFLKIMVKAPNLKVINGYVSQPLQSEKFDLCQHGKDISFKNLEEFSIDRMSLPLHEYLWLFTRSPKLSSFDLSYVCSYYAIKEDLLKTNFPQIKELKVGNGSLRDAGVYFGKILKVTPHLERITPSKPGAFIYVTAEDIPNDLHLPKLKFLMLSSFSFSGEAIVKLLKAAPDLEILDLSNCKNCEDLNVSLLQNISLKNLHTFLYNNSKLPLATIIKLATLEKNNHEHLISQSKITLTSGFLTKFGNSSPDFTLPEDVIFPTIKSIVLDDIAKIDSKFFHNLIKATSNVETIKVSKLYLSNVKLLSNTLSSLKYLSMYRITISENSVEHLIINAPKLESIEILENTVVKRDGAQKLDLPKDLKFDNLQNIRIKDKVVSSSFLRQIIAKSKNLKQLCIEGFSFNKIKVASISYPQFSELNEFIIENAYIDTELARHVLSTAKFLKRIEIKTPEKETGFFDKLIYGNKSLPHVTRLVLHNQKLPRTFLQQISFIFPNVKELIFDNCIFWDRVNEFTAGSKLQFLKNLTIKHCNINLDDLINFVTNAELLEGIIIDACDLIDINRKQRKWLEKIDLKLANVKYFGLKNLKIDHQLFISLLVGAPHTLSLDVNSLKLTNLPETFDYYSLQFSNKLTIIDYDNSNFPADIILALYAKNTQLRNLTLEEHHLRMPSAKIEFRGIETLKLSKSTVDYQLFRLLLNNPSLKSLNVDSMALSNVPNEEELDGANIRLPNLEIFNFQSSNLSPKTIFSVYKACSGPSSKLKGLILNNYIIDKDSHLTFPKLEGLDLSHCKVDFFVFISLLCSEKRFTVLKMNSLQLTNIPEKFDYSTLKMKLALFFEFENSNLPLELICTMFKFGTMGYTFSLGEMCFKNYNDAKSKQEMSNPLIKTPNVERIDIKKSHFFVENFLTLLCGAENIATLSCEESLICNRLSDINLCELIENQRCGKLQTIHFESQTITAELFLAILLLAPNLKKIVFTNVQILDLQPENIPSNLILNNLLEFTLTNSGLSKEVIEKLRSCAPNLKSIDTKEDKSLVTNNLSELEINNVKRLIDKNHQARKSFTSNSENQLGIRVNGLAFAKHFAKILSSNCKLPEITAPSSALLIDFGLHSSAPSTKNNSGMEASTVSVDNEFKSYGRMEDRIKVSSDDLQPGSKLKAKEFFVSEPYIHPRMYRLRSYVLTIENGSIVISARKPKSLINQSTKINFLKTPIRDQFKQLDNQPHRNGFFEDELIISQEWTEIPSLLADEAIIDFYCDFPGGYELQYSPDTKFYYIRAKNLAEARISKVSFTLNFDKANRSAKKFDQEMQAHINHCSSFHEGNLKVSSDANDVQILEARYEQQIGACEDRSIVLDYKLTKLLGGSDNQVSIIRNHLHAFIEIDDGTCYQLDLGGYAAKVELEKIEKIDLGTANTQVKDKSLATKPQAPELPVKITEQKKETEKSVEQKLEVEQNQNRTFENPVETRKKKIITEADLCPSLITWKKSRKDLSKTSAELFQQIILPGQKSLLKVHEPDDCLKIVASFAEKIKKPYLFIDSPDDLQWKAPGLKFNKKIGNDILGIKKCFSKLRYFLETYPEGVLFINWSNFSNTEIAALHSVIDEKRQLEGEDLPSPLPIVGFYCDDLPNAYKDADFTTRHDEIYPEWPYELSTDLFHNRKKELAVSPLKDEVLTIDLFETEDWEGLLFGAINIHKNVFSMQFSDFSNELGNKTTPLTRIHLKNPPWHLREFQLFWQHALQQKSFALYGRTFTLDDKFQLSYSRGYEYKTQIIRSSNKDEDCDLYPLNSHTMHEFFPHYIYKNSSFERTTGILQKLKDKTLTLVVTENLSKSQWCRLLTEASSNNVRLKLSLAVDVKLPVELGNVAYQEFKPRIFSLEENVKAIGQDACSIIYAKESSSAISTELLKKYPDAMYISLDSTHDFGDLFYQVHPTTTEETILAHFIDSDPWLALKNGETVIIEGRLPSALVNALSPLLISGKSELIIHGESVKFKGKLLIVTDQEVSFAANQFHCNAVASQIPAIFQSSKDTKQEIPTSFKSAAQKQISEKFEDDPNDLSEEAYQRYKSYRFNNIITGFQQSPIIAYTGPTGIGKTTYIEKEFEQDYFQRTGRRAKLYIGEGEMEAFAAHKNADVDPFLFIDEANLSDQKLSILKGLTSKKPHLLKNGHYYNLSNNKQTHQTQHRVILACNLKEYAGGVRQQEDFFAEHAAIVKCCKPNHAYLYHEILQPQLKNHPQQRELAKIQLALFDKVNEIAGTNNPLLSPRHLHMMTVLLVAYLNQIKNASVKITHLAISACLAILGEGLAAVKQHKFSQFLKTQFGFEQNHFAIEHEKIISEKISKLSQGRKDSFTFTKSRLPILCMLDLFLSLRSQPNFHFGLLLEGDSAVGKSTLVRKYLELLGVDYIQFTFSNNYQTDCKLLLEAYYARKVIIIDELNAGGQVYERLINTLIMGTEKEINDIAKEIMPDEYQQRIKEYEAGKALNKPRSLIVATQNSLSLAGRQALTVAMQARFVPLSVPEYQSEELEEILVARGVKLEAAKTWVAAFRLNTAYAVFHRLEPKPNLRDLLKAAGVAHAEDNHVHVDQSMQLKIAKQQLEQTGLAENLNNFDFSKTNLVNIFCDKEKVANNVLLDLFEEATESSEDKLDNNISVEIESLTNDKELLQDIEEKIGLLRDKIEAQHNSRKNDRRQCKIEFLTELKDNYECNQLDDSDLKDISKSDKYRSLFRFFGTSEMSRFRDHCRQSLKIADQAKKFEKQEKSNYVVEKNLVNDLKTHAQKLHDEFNKDRHAILADRRWQKYTALRKVIRLYETNQLTKQHIGLLETEFGKMYNGLFSHKTLDLMERVKTSLGVNKRYAVKVFPGIHSARVVRVPIKHEAPCESVNEINLDLVK